MVVLAAVGAGAGMDTNRSGDIKAVTMSLSRFSPGCGGLRRMDYAVAG